MHHWIAHPLTLNSITWLALCMSLLFHFHIVIFGTNVLVFSLLMNPCQWAAAGWRTEIKSCDQKVIGLNTNRENVKKKEWIDRCFSVVNVIKVWLQSVASFCEFVWLCEYEYEEYAQQIFAWQKKVWNKYSKGWPELFCCRTASTLPWASLSSSIIDRDWSCWAVHFLYWIMLQILVVQTEKKLKVKKQKQILCSRHLGCHKCHLLFYTCFAC